MKLHMDLGKSSYDIVVERGLLNHIGDYINVNRKVMIISDDGVPRSYCDMLLKQCPKGYSHIVAQGEGAKSLEVFADLCKELLHLHFSRKDLIIALGGGVIGDLSGYVAASYMRGIDFVQVPTTTLSQIDSSIGGKVAINLDGVKNIIGAFYQPKMVLIDPDTLSTLPRRHYANGLVEALKAGLIYDESLFALFEQGDAIADIELIITKALHVKKAVVEQDEKEHGLRKILNFGHTIGHAIESSNHLHDYYHGECVAFGMLYFIRDEAIKQRVISVYKKLGLPRNIPMECEKWLEMIQNDKKADGDLVETIWVDSIGTAHIRPMHLEEIKRLMEDKR